MKDHKTRITDLQTRVMNLKTLRAVLSVAQKVVLSVVPKV
jgi:hypothetical protein